MTPRYTEMPWLTPYNKCYGHACSWLTRNYLTVFSSSIPGKLQFSGGLLPVSPGNTVSGLDHNPWWTTPRSSQLKCTQESMQRQRSSKFSGVFLPKMCLLVHRRVVFGTSRQKKTPGSKVFCCTYKSSFCWSHSHNGMFSPSEICTRVVSYYTSSP